MLTNGTFERRIATETIAAMRPQGTVAFMRPERPVVDT
jgi:hypothetical protein